MLTGSEPMRVQKLFFKFLTLATIRIPFIPLRSDSWVWPCWVFISSDSPPLLNFMLSHANMFLLLSCTLPSAVKLKLLSVRVVYLKTTMFRVSCLCIDRTPMKPWRTYFYFSINYTLLLLHQLPPLRMPNSEAWSYLIQSVFCLVLIWFLYQYKLY